MHPSYEDRPGAPTACSPRSTTRRSSCRCGPGAARCARPSRRSRRPVPAPPDAHQRGGGARRPGRPGGRAPARHRAADAGGDRRRARARWPHAAGMGGADARVGGALRAARRRHARRTRRARRACSASSRTRFAVVPNGFDAARFAPSTRRPRRAGAARCVDQPRGWRPGRAGKLVRASRGRRGARRGRHVRSTSAASPRSSACRC